MAAKVIVDAVVEMYISEDDFILEIQDQRNPQIPSIDFSMFNLITSDGDCFSREIIGRMNCESITSSQVRTSDTVQYCKAAELLFIAGALRRRRHVHVQNILRLLQSV